MTETPVFEALKKLREPFPANQVSKLPKPTKAQTDAVRNDFKSGIRCKLCGAWHHPDVVHLDYVGHAALTDRLLDVDAGWSWEPLALKDGLPAFDASGGLWIKLTVCGITRLGYGHAASKPNQDPGAREKEVIGDALRNAAMRFGAALDLWHKGDLHGDDDDGNEASKPIPKQEPKPAQKPQAKATEATVVEETATATSGGYNPFDYVDPEPDPEASHDPDAIVDDLCERARLCTTNEQLNAMKAADEFKRAYATLPANHKKMVGEFFTARRQGISKGN